MNGGWLWCDATEYRRQWKSGGGMTGRKYGIAPPRRRIVNREWRRVHKTGASNRVM